LRSFTAACIALAVFSATLAAAAETTAKKHKVLFLAGSPSHGYGAHDHLAGSMLLAKSLNESGLPIEAEVYHYNWPADPKAFDIEDEWYYHMRFREPFRGVTPILTDVPPPESLSRPDDPHAGNPAVRAAVARKEPQHTAWARERADGGRGFGFTGGHYHWNWS